MFSDLGGAGLHIERDDTAVVSLHAKVSLLLYVDWIDVLQENNKRKLGVISMRYGMRKGWGGGACAVLLLLNLLSCSEHRVMNLPFRMRNLRQFSFPLAIFQDEPLVPLPLCLLLPHPFSPLLYVPSPSFSQDCLFSETLHLSLPKS